MALVSPALFCVATNLTPEDAGLRLSERSCGQHERKHRRPRRFSRCAAQQRQSRRPHAAPYSRDLFGQVIAALPSTHLGPYTANRSYSSARGVDSEVAWSSTSLNQRFALSYTGNQLNLTANVIWGCKQHRPHSETPTLTQGTRYQELAGLSSSERTLLRPPPSLKWRLSARGLLFPSSARQKMAKGESRSEPRSERSDDLLQRRPFLTLPVARRDTENRS